MSAAERLRWAREQAGHETASDFARKNNIEPATYIHHENGTRGLRVEVAKRYARILDVESNWLLTGEGQPKSKVELSPTLQPVVWAPVITWVQAGKLREQAVDLEDERVRLPVSYHKSTVVALKVKGTSMNRVAPPGSHIIVDHEDCIPQDGKLYVIRRGDETTFKRYRDTGGPVRLEPDSTESHETIYPDSDFVVIGRVISIQIAT